MGRKLTFYLGMKAQMVGCMDEIGFTRVQPLNDAQRLVNRLMRGVRFKA